MSPVTQIRLGSQEFPDRKKECSFLSLNLQQDDGTSALFTQYITQV